jgi:hypothetical protein
MRLIFLYLAIWLSPLLSAQSKDWRLISNGKKIYEHGYCDQPYLVTTSDGTWVCTFTTSPGREGDQIQYIVSTSSEDQGTTWTTPVEIEPAANGIEASWAIPLISDFDRIYVFYTFNGDTIRQMPDGKPIRSDTHGWYCYRYSDDKGATWSERRRLELRLTACDSTNEFSGQVQMFWGIGKPVNQGRNMWFSFTKLGQYFLEKGEGWLFHSDNILTEKDPAKIHWQLLPEGNQGIKNPLLGSVQEEFNLQPMNQEGCLYGVYRTTLGQPADCYSYDQGRSWTTPKLMTYANGLPMRHPRACPRLWKCKNGKYLIWYHNNGGQGFEHRNPAWVAGGIEKDGKIYWSQPEIFIYGWDHSYETGRFSYPDLIEENGKYWVSTTQKTAATIHEVPAKFFEGLWEQFSKPKITREGLALELENSPPENVRLPEAISFEKGGFALEFWITPDHVNNEFKSMNLTHASENISIDILNGSTLEFTMTDGLNSVTIQSDPTRVKKGEKQHVGIIVDGQARICYMLIDGSICDGGGKNIFGFKWFDETLLNLSVSEIELNFPTAIINKMRIYDQPISTSQMVNNYRAENK